MTFARLHIRWQPLRPYWSRFRWRIRDWNGFILLRFLHIRLKTDPRAAVARFVMRGREHLALIRPYKNALILHTMHYGDEIRSVKELGSDSGKVQASELNLAERLIDDFSRDRFDADKFEDTHRNKIPKVAQAKSGGAREWKFRRHPGGTDS